MKVLTTLSRCAVVAALSFTLLPFPVLAQIEEITVTVRKTTEDLQEVPLAITALTGDDIERLNLQDLSDITQQDTSVQFDEGFTPSDTRITIRGLSPTRGRPNAATLIDGIDVTSEAVSNAGGSTLINPRLIDIERIEVVKGPQSALYGRSAFAGAIQYVTKDPSDVLEAEIFVQSNSEDDREARGSVSIPLTDTLGMLINGYAWDSRGYYRNLATNAYIGGGDGLGSSITFKWEPTDTVGVKWRTEYSDDQFDPAAQVNLGSRNRLVNLRLAVPNATNCNFTTNSDGIDVPGPLDASCLPIVDQNNVVIDPGNPNGDKWYLPILNNGTPNDPSDDTLGPVELVANETTLLNSFFNTNYNANGDTLGDYDPNNPFYADQYEKAIEGVYVGALPDAKNLRPSLSPNYREGIGATNPADAVDYDGTNRQVFRTSLKVDWAINDTLDFVSNTGYIDSNVTIQTDIGKYYVDECSPNTNILSNQAFYPDPLDPTNVNRSYADALTDANIDDFRPFAPCDPTLGGDGINDAAIQFIQDDSTDTKQYSQELRLAWQATEDFNFTTGLQYWKEKLELIDYNSTHIMQGAECYLTPATVDASTYLNGQNFLDIDPLQDQCGTTTLIAAYWMPFTYQGRLEQPSFTGRETEHYSWYGSADWDLTDKLSVRIEARYTNEDNSVTGSVQTPCVNGNLPDSWYVKQGLPVPPNNDCNDLSQADPNRLEVANGGQPTGPSTVILCGQIGRCDRLGVAPLGTSPYYAGQNPPVGQPNFDGYSWWAFGYRPGPGQLQTLERTDRYWAPKATVEYFWTEEIMTYLSWSRGIKPGGFSLLTSGAFGLDANLDGNYDEIEFTPERLDVWELGAKTTLFNNRLRLNGAVFFQDFKDKQVTVQKVLAGTTGTVVENIDGSEVTGLEVDATWQPNQYWTVSGGYTFLDTEYTDYTIVTTAVGDILRINAGNPSQNCSDLQPIEGGDLNDFGCVMSFNGNELERAPRHAFLANVTYTNNFFDTGIEWYGEANYRWQDSRWMEAFNAVKFPAYDLLDLRLGLQADSWDFQLFIENALENTKPITGGPNVGIPTGSFGFGFTTPPDINAQEGGPGINAGPKLPQDVYINMPNPRIIGANVKFRFGS